MSVNNEEEILRDLPLLHERINKARKNQIDMERAIMEEEQKIMELGFYIREEKRRPEGERPQYDLASLEENQERHRRNIETFKGTIAREEESIKATQKMIQVLEEDLKRPTELVIDMNKLREKHPFKDM